MFIHSANTIECKELSNGAAFINKEDRLSSCMDFEVLCMCVGCGRNQETGAHSKVWTVQSQRESVGEAVGEAGTAQSRGMQPTGGSVMASWKK